MTVHRLPPAPAPTTTVEQLPSDLKEAIASLAVDEPVESISIGPDVADKTPRSPIVSYLLRFSTPNGRRTAIQSIERIARAIGVSADAIPWEKLGPTETGAINARLVAMGHSPSTIRLTRTILKGVLSEAQKMGLITGDQLMAATSWPRLQGKRAPAGRMLTDDEVQRLRAHCRSLSPAVYRAMALALVACALGGGMRREELAGVEADALSDDERHLRFVGKGRKEVVQPLPEWAAADVRAWLEVRRRFPLATQTMFVKIDPRGRRIIDRPLTPWEIWKLIRDLQQGAGLPRFSPHDLRRTFASTLIEQEGLDKAKTLMRHENVSTTLVYDRRPQKDAEKALGSIEKWGGG